ncbi:hypothetical protein NC652_015084 [Populus alba x Populus x berolinensis]|uniref:Uncharacterized protein n=1 Tax=Populus alba x Populus x berolinensis TaxID=444605 RepID=A0AAD6QSK4_9ROSI|nr:hypothetical protein NC651_014674 [Populus alba x Populus x berolinensis]KAJ6931791.1 hypothetical protein NC652_015084 [Populus alba x Populus x berolinensis]KAJ6995617.1 hypothetical protein NC653_012458 [Populus alba x Populus x berolinensis]KAJ6998725.1 hypothetical protein NC653_014784 [Populus alba x Populus x berolinensis]
MTRTKQIFDRYQKTHWIDLWSSHYEVWSLFCFLQKCCDVLVIIFYRQKMGQGLNDLSFQDLRNP